MPYKPKITTRGISTTTVTTDTIPKGSPMTNNELDSNFLNLRDASIGIAGDDSGTIDLGMGNTLKVVGTGGLTTAASGQTLTIDGSGIAPAPSTTGNLTFEKSIGLTANSGGSDTIATGSSGHDTYFKTSGDGTYNFINTTSTNGISISDSGLAAGGSASGNLTAIGITGSGNIDLNIRAIGTGKVALSGIKYPSADGSNGQVLTTNGSGVLSFTTIAGTGTISFSGNTISSTNSNDDIALDPAGTGNIQMRGHIDVLDNKITTSSSAGNINFDKNIVLQRSNSTAIVTDSTNALKLGAGGDGSNKPGIGIGYDHYNAANTNDISFNMVSTGRLRVVDQNSTQTQTTIGANGAASALTANPVGYLKIKINDTEYIIPYYNG